MKNMQDEILGDEYNEEEELDEDVLALMEDHDLDRETAEQVWEAMDEFGVDEDDALMLVEEGVYD